MPACNAYCHVTYFLYARRPPHPTPTTTTRSNRGFELSPRVRSSKIVMTAAPIASLATQTELQINDKHTDKIAGHFVAFAPGIPQAHLKKPMSSSITAFGPTGTLPGFG